MATKKFTVTGDYNEVGRTLTSEVAEYLSDDKMSRVHMTMVIEHLMGAFGLDKDKDAVYVVTLNIDPASKRLTFSATPQG